MSTTSPYRRKATTPPLARLGFLLIAIVFLGLMVVMVLKVVNTDSGARNSKNKAITQAEQSAAGKNSASSLPDLRLAVGAACLTERQTLQDAEILAEANNAGTAQTIDELLAQGTLTSRPKYLTVVIKPDGGYEIKPLKVGTCT